jgi:hypothetical protein
MATGRRGKARFPAGQGAIALGDTNNAAGQAAIALGQGSNAIGDGTVAMGLSASAIAMNAVAVGTSATASGAGSTAVGNNAQASQPNSSAYGNNASANGTSSTAIGAGATVAAGTVDSTAIGAGARTLLTQQMVLGTADQSITAPGIDSNLSRSRQSGPLGIVTSDAFGNLASDNGSLFKETAIVKAGAAIAMALSDPSIADNQRFGIKMNWGGFDGANAVGFSAAGVLARGLVAKEDSLTLSGAGAWGEASAEGYNKSTFGGRASLQFAW